MRFLLFLEPVAKNDTPLVISLHKNIKHRITLNERKQWQVAIFVIVFSTTKQHKPITTEMLISLAVLVMKNTGKIHKTNYIV